MELCEVCCCYLKLTYFNKLRSILIATYSVRSYVSIKAMARGVQPTCVCVCVCVCVTASVSLAEHNVQFDSRHDDLNDLCRLYCREPICCFAATHGWDGATLLGLQGKKSSHKEFSFLLVAIKCLSAIFILFFYLYCVPFQLQAIEWLSFFFSWYILPFFIGGGRGSEERGEWRGPGLPATSSDWNWRRPAQHWNHPVLFESIWIIWTS